MAKKEDLRHSMVIIFSVVAVMFILFLLPFDAITGAVVEADSATVKQQVGTLVSTFPLVAHAKNADVCFVVNMDETTQYSYKVIKRGNSVEIVTKDLYCDGAEQEDFIIGYIDYDAFKDHVNSMTCSKFKRGNARDFYFYISKFVKPGGQISCTTDFRDKYCVSLNYCLSKSEMESLGLGCCLNLPESQQELALKAAQAGVKDNQRESSPELRSPFDFGSILMTIIIVVIIVAVLGGGALYYATSTKKKGLSTIPSKSAASIPSASSLADVPADQIEEVREYILSCKSEGYNRMQIKHALLESGWPQDKAEAFLVKFLK